MIVKPVGRMTAIDYGIHAVQVIIGLMLWMWLAGDGGAVFAKFAGIF